jgi:hypothetical protein
VGDEAVTIIDIINIPAQGSHFCIRVLHHNLIRRTITSHCIVVIAQYKFIELEMSCDGYSFQRHTFLKTTISRGAIDARGDDLTAILVEVRSRLLESNRESDCIGHTLTQRTSCHFNT